MMQNIPAKLLVPTPVNVRKVKTGIDALAVSIASADGLIQNLVVTAREDGKFEVIAGERRRRAIAKLIKDGIWGKDAVVPCMVREPENATSISYIENAERAAMHHADAIRALGCLHQEGLSEEAIANRYGYDPRDVRKYLALAGVSPKVLNALAADKIDLACVQAFTLTDDHARQERILKRASSAYQVRELLTEEKLTTQDKLFKFIGMDAHRDAGGTITGDLFAEEGEGYADNPELVERLADEKLDALADEMRAQGWGDVVVALETPYNSYSWNRLYSDETTRSFNPVEQERMDALTAKREARLVEIEADSELDFDPEYDGVLMEIDEEIDQIGTVEHHFSDDAKASGRILIVLGHQGKINVSHYSIKAQRAVARDANGAPAPRPLYDARMTEELTRMRTMALQSEVASNQPLAFAVLLDALLPIVTDRFAPDHAVELRVRADIQEPCQHFDYNSMEMASAFDGVAGLIGAAPKQPALRFAWIMSLDESDVQRMLAACSGALLNATQGKYSSRERLESVNRIARAAKLDMRKHWEGGLEFYGRVSKKALLSALTEACGTETAENCAKMKRDALAQTCAERIPGRGWLPPVLVTPEEPEIEAEDAAVGREGCDSHDETGDGEEKDEESLDSTGALSDIGLAAE